MNEVNEGLEYAQMLEIPVSTVNVVKKKSWFSRKSNKSDDLKDSVVVSVNAKLDGEAPQDEKGFVETEDLNVPPAKKKNKLGVSGSVLICETVAACLLAAGIFLTNIFVPNTAINTFVGNLTAVKQKEAAYNQFTLTSPVSDLSDAEVSVTADGVIHFTDNTNVYPLCNGEVASVSESDGLYTVKIAHTSTFCSVITGLDTVYAGVGDDVKGNLPIAYSKGESEVRVSMYDGDTLLNCYTLAGAVPVWNS